MECFVQDLVPSLNAIGRSRDGSYSLVFSEWSDLVSFSICSTTSLFSSIFFSLPPDPINSGLLTHIFRNNYIIIVILICLIIGIWVSWINHTLISYWFRILEWSCLNNRTLNFLFKITLIICFLGNLIYG